MSEEINSTLKGIHKTLALIHREMFISNLPTEFRDIQREYFAKKDMIETYRTLRDIYKRRMEALELDSNSIELENNDLYNNAKNSYQINSDRVHKIFQEILQLKLKGAKSTEFCLIDMGDYND